MRFDLDRQPADMVTAIAPAELAGRGRRGGQEPRQGHRRPRSHHDAIAPCHRSADRRQTPVWSGPCRDCMKEIQAARW